jgi:hypothetical protein
MSFESFVWFATKEAIDPVLVDVVSAKRTTTNTEPMA